MYSFRTQSTIKITNHSLKMRFSTGRLVYMTYISHLLLHFSSLLLSSLFSAIVMICMDYINRPVWPLASCWVSSVRTQQEIREEENGEWGENIYSPGSSLIFLRMAVFHRSYCSSHGILLYSISSPANLCSFLSLDLMKVQLDVTGCTWRLLVQPLYTTFIYLNIPFIVKPSELLQF